MVSYQASRYSMENRLFAFTYNVTVFFAAAGLAASLLYA
jgi:hypothetical protein